MPLPGVIHCLFKDPHLKIKDPLFAFPLAMSNHSVFTPHSDTILYFNP
jgi:hypothetical protein